MPEAPTSAWTMPRVPAWTLPVVAVVVAILAAVGSFYYGSRIQDSMEGVKSACDLTELHAERSAMQAQLEREEPLPLTQSEFKRAYDEGTRALAASIENIKEQGSRNAVAQLGQLSRLAENVQVQNATITEARDAVDALGQDQRYVRLSLDTLLLYTRPDSDGHDGGDHGSSIPGTPGSDVPTTPRTPRSHSQSFVMTPSSRTGSTVSLLHPERG